MIGDLKTDIEKLIEPIILQEGFELIEVKLSRHKSNYRLQLFVDSETGITLDECAQISRLAGAALDVADLLESKYFLEVSSPGLDRPLVSERDFRRRIGETIRVEYMENSRKKRITGKLTGVESGEIVLDDKGGTIRIALKTIEQGKVII